MGSFIYKYVFIAVSLFYETLFYYIDISVSTGNFLIAIY